MSQIEFIPARSTHAITGAMFACEMAAPVSSDVIQLLIEKYEAQPKIKEFLNRKSEDKGFSFVIDNQEAHVEQPGGVVGVSFERYNQDGFVEWALSLRGNLLLVSCNAYTRWSEISPEALSLLRWGLDCISPLAIGVASYGLQYQDEFLWPGPAVGMDSASFFAAGSDFLPSHFLSKKGMWHNYSGWFEDAVEPSLGARLVNMNIAFVQRDTNGLAQLVMSHKAIYSDHKDAPADPEALFNVLHEEHKSLLDKLLATSIKEKIKLGS